MIFTLYMIPDPATTPVKPLRQALFGIAVAAVYGVLLVQHVVYGLFIALAIVCGLRGVALYAWAAWQSFRANQQGPLMLQPGVAGNAPGTSADGRPARDRSHFPSRVFATLRPCVEPPTTEARRTTTDHRQLTSPSEARWARVSGADIASGQVRPKSLDARAGDSGVDEIQRLQLRQLEQVRQ